ncbi:DUF3060 domain-containing protein [Mycolicibacterium frederiksbergense]|uniref:DUF3060 domain-containing protein n=1 Tax=Mycolicibacterium frederiksbergense TaxID=117567 RepID=UPI00265B78BA|nr:DUF3060 domain-containing protein [Mycolicibacterium frederiksbergense]MDO0975206.1 DUF3060 domain-containing protein [Mycolicibacterium frederiksbergense]
MNPQDDPEARIRALEPTELGSENAGPTAYGYGTPPPPTQPWPEQSPYVQPHYGQTPYGAQPYGTGYAVPYPPEPSGSGFRPWMAVVPVALVFLLLAGGAAAYFMFTTTSAPEAPGIAGGGDVLTDGPEAPVLPSLPSLPTIITIPTDIAEPPSGSAPEPGTTLTISGIGTNKSVTCNDNIVIISGANNTVDITGHCTAVTVSGFENVVTAESTREIAVSGFDNSITYRTGEPQVSESGSGNSITQG